MPCPHNNIDCPCTKEGCPRHGKCCECVAHHKEHGKKLPACLRGIEWERWETGKTLIYDVRNGREMVTGVNAK